MLRRDGLSEKVMVLGIDGLDPRFTKRMLKEGKMPNVQKFIDRGACREDLMLLGGNPTVTPPMWTTLATGCYANVHGITGFYRANPDELDLIDYNMDSRKCTAELQWNAFAEAGKKTLVWHWPGSAWPPTSNNENLLVIDGTSPGSVNMSVAEVDKEFFVVASADETEIKIVSPRKMEAPPVCVVEDLEMEMEADLTKDGIEYEFNAIGCSTKMIICREEQTAVMGNMIQWNRQTSPLKDATKWAMAVPEGAKEFVITPCGSAIRRIGLALKNENGVYDRVEIYKNKKATEPMVVLPVGKYVTDIIDEAVKRGKKYEANRNMKLVEIAEDGSSLLLYVSAAMDIHNDTLFHPRRLYKEITENVGYPTPTSMGGNQDKIQITECMLEGWNKTAQWTADSILHLIEAEKLECVFSHFHNIDLEAHMFIKHLAETNRFNRLPHEDYVKFMEDVYVQTDWYIGKFYHLLDEGWSIIITSDHGLIAPANRVPLLADVNGINVGVMKELGYTVLKTDENGNEIGEIDWTKTRAVAQREQHIYLNIKGRNKHTMPDGTVIDGIVDPEEQYILEEQIMTDLYGYKDKETGHRVVGVALRNKDAVLLGQGGPEAGDICYWLAEGYNFDHADGLATNCGEADTSLSPIFIAAGPGIKENFKTDRIIRQIDVAPTVAVLGGVRMAAQTEGAPVYQILKEEY